MRKLTLLCLLLLVVNQTFAQSLTTTDQVGDLELIDMMPLPAPSYEARISPDGSRIAWFAPRSVCILEISTDITRCSDVPADTDDMRHILSLNWMWDNRTLVVNRVFGVHLYDMVTRQFKTVTTEEDNTRFRSIIPGRDGTIYMIRQTIDPDSNNRVIGQSLFMMEDFDADPAMLLSFDSEITVTMSGMNGRFSQSPDGSKLALTSYPDFDTLAGTLWILDLETFALEPVTTAADALLIGMPDIMMDDGWRYSTSIYGVDWLADSSGVVVGLDNGSYQIRGVVPAAYTLNLPTGEITPWTDFSGIPDYNTFEMGDVRENPDYITRYDRHDEMTYIPGFDTLIYANWPTAFRGVGISALTEPGADPLRLFFEEETELQYQGSPDYNNIGTDGDSHPGCHY